MSTLFRKYYKITGLHNVFEYDETSKVFFTDYANFTTRFVESYGNLINEHTTLFITCDASDEGYYVQAKDDDNNIVQYKLHPADTLIWARNDVYCVSSKGVTDIDYDSINRKFTIIYSDGTTQEIVAAVMGYSAGDNINISADNLISALGYTYEETGKNFLLGSNSANTNTTNAFVTGTGNIAVSDSQLVCGTYNNTDSDKTVIVGIGTIKARKNGVTIDKTGVIYSATDVTAGNEDSNPSYKLSDIHNVVDDDWVIIK